MGETGSMKWIYGKPDWKTFERGQENCYLMTNGLGGYSSLTVTGSAARNDHAFLMACTKAPNNRYNMVHRLAERLEIKQETYTLSSQEFADGNCENADRSRENGCRYLTEFAYEDTPVWRFLINGVEIEKEAALKQGENTAVVCYRVTNRSRGDVRLTVTPFYQFAPKGEGAELNGTFRHSAGRVESGHMGLHYMTNGRVTEIPETKFMDQAVLVGEDGDDRITVEELAELSGRFNYEFVCCLGKRIPRVYVSSGSLE